MERYTRCAREADRQFDSIARYRGERASRELEIVKSVYTKKKI